MIDNDEFFSRDHSTYREIENFQPYELTTCIAYEMAKRNEVINEKLKKLDLLIEFEDKYPYLKMESSKLEFMDTPSNKSDEFAKLKQLCDLPSITFIEELEKRLDLEKNKAFDNIAYEKYIEEPERIFEDESKLMEQVYKDKKLWRSHLEKNISSSNIYHMKNYFEKDLINNHYIYPDSSISKIPGSTENYYFDHMDKTITNNGLKNVQEYNAGFFYLIQHDGSSNLNIEATSEEDNKNNDDEISNNTYPELELNVILPTFKRKMHEPRTSLLALNFSKPLEDNLAYLKSIYEYLDNSNEIITKSPLEYIGENLNIDSINFKNMSAREWADCFFIYDFYNLFHDDSDAAKWLKLDDIFCQYHGVKIKKLKQERRKDKNKGDNSTYKIIQLETYEKLKDSVYKESYKSFYSETTLRERYKLMKSLIEKEKYKALFLK